MNINFNRSKKKWKKKTGKPGQTTILKTSKH